MRLNTTEIENLFRYVKENKNCDVVDLIESTTSIGDIIIMHDLNNECTLDITDYDCW